MTTGDWRMLADGIALVATDLDGTLLRPDTTVSAYTVDTLARARDAGLPVVFVTGRPPRWIHPVAAHTGHRGIAIGANGAVALDLASGRLLAVHPLALTALEEVVGRLRVEVPGIGFAIEWADPSATDGTETFAYEPGFVPRLPMPLPPLDVDLLEAARGRQVVKVLARVPDTVHDADSLLDLALGHVAHLVAVTHSNSTDVLLEMSAAGVTKGSTLAELADSWGVPADAVAAMGDMPNDVPMLTWAGVGLGVEGAHRSVLEAADAVLPGPLQDGVAGFVDAVLRSRHAA
jgi:hydroxymethylpyrimidine pyrophosphatase-like HAD family hydrolase